MKNGSDGGTELQVAYPDHVVEEMPNNELYPTQ